MADQKLEFNIGDKVSWIKPMACVPHPEGTLKDREGNVLPVFRDKLEKGRVISLNYHGYSCRPDWAEQYKDAMCGERYYDQTISVSDKTIQKI